MRPAALCLHHTPPAEAIQGLGWELQSPKCSQHSQVDQNRAFLRLHNAFLGFVYLGLCRDFGTVLHRVLISK